MPHASSFEQRLMRQAAQVLKQVEENKCHVFTFHASDQRDTIRRRHLAHLKNRALCHGATNRATGSSAFSRKNLFSFALRGVVDYAFC